MRYPQDPVGSTPDDAVTTVSLTATLMSYVKGILNLVSSSNTVLGNIFGLANSMLRLMGTEGTVTLDGNEQVLWIVDAPQGLFRPMTFEIDMTNLTAAETAVVRVYNRIANGGNLILKSETPFDGVQHPPLKPILLGPNRFGTSVTIQRTAGGVKDLDWAVFYGRGT